MTIPTKMDAGLANKVLEETNKALEEVAKRLGLTYRKARGRYSTTETTVKAAFLVPEVKEGGVVVDVEETDFKREATRFGLSPDLFGRKFKYGGVVYRIAGVRPKRRKYPILGKPVNGGADRVFPSYLVNANLLPADKPPPGSEGSVFRLPGATIESEGW